VHSSQCSLCFAVFYSQSGLRFVQNPESPHETILDLARTAGMQLVPQAQTAFGMTVFPRYSQALRASA